MPGARGTYQKFPGVNPNATVRHQTDAEYAMLKSGSPIRIWVDAEGYLPDASGNVLNLHSRIRGDGNAEIIFSQTSTTDAPSVVTTTDGRKGVLQGLTAIGGTALSGETKRMLVGNELATLPHSGSGASVTLTVNTGAITAGAVAAGGTGYTRQPHLRFVDTSGTGAKGYCTISGGAITGVVITNGGSGYTGSATAIVVPQPDPFAAYHLGAHKVDANGTYFSTQNYANPTTLRHITGGQLRFYEGEAVGTLIQSATGVMTGALALIAAKWDGTYASIWKNGVQVAGPTAVAFDEGYTDISIRLGASNNSSTGTTTAFNGMEGYTEAFIVAKYGADADAMVKAMVNERHAGLVA